MLSWASILDNDARSRRKISRILEKCRVRWYVIIQAVPKSFQPNESERGKHSPKILSDGDRQTADVLYQRWRSGLIKWNEVKLKMVVFGRITVWKT